MIMTLLLSPRHSEVMTLWKKFHRMRAILPTCRDGHVELRVCHCASGVASARVVEQDLLPFLMDIGLLCAQTVTRSLASFVCLFLLCYCRSRGSGQLNRPPTGVRMRSTTAVEENTQRTSMDGKNVLGTFPHHHTPVPMADKQPRIETRSATRHETVNRRYRAHRCDGRHGRQNGRVGTTRAC